MSVQTTPGTLTAGNSRTFELAPAATLTLTLLPNCRVTVTETPETVSASDAGGNSPRTHNHQLAGVVTYGPYAMGGSVVVDNASNSGSTVTWGRKDTVVTTSSDGLSLVSGDGSVLDVLPPKRPRLILKRMLDQVGVTYANSGTAAVVTVDTASPFGGTAIKLAIPTGNTWTEIAYTGNSIAAFDDHVVWRVWVENANHVTQIQTFAGTSGYGRLYQRTYSISASNANLFNGEHFIAAGPMFATAANTFLTGVDTFADTKLRIFYGGAGATVNVWVERVVVHGNERPTVVFTLDDCALSHYTRAYPKLTQHGIRGVFGINSGDIGGSASLYMSAAQVLELANAGHEIHSHGVTNTAYPTSNAATYTAAYKTGLNALNAITARASSIYHPWVQGGNGTDVQATMLAQGVQIIRGTPHTNSGKMNMFADGVGARRVNVMSNGTDNRTLADLTTDVDNCIKYGGTMLFMTHEIVDSLVLAGVETSLVAWNGLVDYVASKRPALRVLGISDLYDQWRAAGYIDQ